MNTETRRATYIAQSPNGKLTPKQRRRLNRKALTQAKRQGTLQAMQAAGD